MKKKPNIRKIIDGQEIEISGFTGQHYSVEKDKRMNPVHTPSLGIECGCSGCERKWR